MPYKIYSVYALRVGTFLFSYLQTGTGGRNLYFIQFRDKGVNLVDLELFLHKRFLMCDTVLGSENCVNQTVTYLAAMPPCYLSAVLTFARRFPCRPAIVQVRRRQRT